MLSKFKAFVDYVEVSTGLRLVLAGGFCRDTIHGVKPKDADFFVLGENDKEVVRSKLRKAGFKFTYTGKYGEGRGNPEYKGVFKGWLFGIDIDIILWENPADTKIEVVKKFDLNVNQYWMGAAGDIKFFPDAPHITKEFKVLREDDPERAARIQRKLMYNA